MCEHINKNGITNGIDALDSWRSGEAVSMEMYFCFCAWQLLSLSSHILPNRYLSSSLVSPSTVCNIFGQSSQLQWVLWCSSFVRGWPQIPDHLLVFTFQVSYHFPEGNDKSCLLTYSIMHFLFLFEIDPTLPLEYFWCLVVSALFSRHKVNGRKRSHSWVNNLVAWWPRVEVMEETAV